MGACSRKEHRAAECSATMRLNHMHVPPHSASALPAQQLVLHSRRCESDNPCTLNSAFAISAECASARQSATQSAARRLLPPRPILLVRRCCSARSNVAACSDYQCSDNAPYSQCRDVNMHRLERGSSDHKSAWTATGAIHNNFL